MISGTPSSAYQQTSHAEIKYCNMWNSKQQVLGWAHCMCSPSRASRNDFGRQAAKCCTQTHWLQGCLGKLRPTSPDKHVRKKQNAIRKVSGELRLRGLSLVLTACNREKAQHTERLSYTTGCVVSMDVFERVQVDSWINFQVTGSLCGLFIQLELICRRNKHILFILAHLEDMSLDIIWMNKTSPQNNIIPVK